MHERASKQGAAKLRGGGGRWSEQDAREVLKRQRASGQSIAAFSRSAGIEPKRLYWWAERFGSARPGPTRALARPVATSFVPVTVKSPQQPPLRGRAALSVRLGEALEIEIYQTDASTVAWVALLAIELERSDET
jgi:hypothetical protein